jgi:hypothetical protein
MPLPLETRRATAQDEAAFNDFIGGSTSLILLHVNAATAPNKLII